MRFFLFWILSAAAANSPPACFFPLAYLAEADETPLSLIVRTHRDLMSALGNRLDAKVLRKMAEEKDPFRLPEESQYENAALVKSLDELHRMLEGRKWASDAVRAALLEDLQSRIVDGQLAESARDHAVVEAANRVARLSLLEGRSVVLSPDGRFLVTYPRGHSMDPIPRQTPSLTGSGKAVPIEIRDLVTGQTENYSVYNLLPHHLSFDGTGQNLLVGGSGVLHQFPFQNGKLDVGAVRTVGTRIVNKAYAPWIEKNASGDRVYFFSKQASDRVLHAFDLNAGKRRTVKLDGLETKEARDKLAGWGLVPGTGEVWTLTKNGKEQSIRTYSVPARGKAVPGQPLELPRSEFPYRIARFSEGPGFIAYHFDAILKYDGLSPSERPKKLPLPTESAQVQSVVPVPGGKRAVALVTNSTNEWLVFYDLEQNRILGQYGLPEESHFGLTVIGNGGRVAIQQHTDNLLLIHTPIME